MSAMRGASLAEMLVAALNDARSRTVVVERTPVRVQAIGDDWRNGWQTVRINKSNDPTDDDVLFADRRAGDEDDVTITEAASSPVVDFGTEGRVSGTRRFAVALEGGGKGNAHARTGHQRDRSPLIPHHTPDGLSRPGWRI